MIVLDTNVLAELMRRRPEPQVMAWVAARPPTALFTTSVTQAEVLYGVALLPDGKRRTDLERAARQMFSEDFAERVLPCNAAAAEEFAAIAAARRRGGRPIAQLDAQIAAVARSRGAGVATRNLHDFEHCGVELYNPWELRA